MGTDRYAYCSRLRQVDPVAKTVLSTSAGAVCLLCGGLAPGLGTLLVMGILTTVWGKIPGRVFVRFLGIPITFLLLGCVTIAVGIYDGNTGGVWGLSLGSQVLGVTPTSVHQALCVIAKSLGVISAVYFLTLNTPMTDLTGGLRRMHVPMLLIELMDLIYRFIFVLTETAGKIRTAQDSRLGYQGVFRSLSSLGTLSSMVFLRAWKKADNVYAALESRGYTGTLLTVSEEYRPGKLCYGLIPLVWGTQMLCLLLEGKVFG